MVRRPQLFKSSHRLCVFAVGSAVKFNTLFNLAKYMFTNTRNLIKQLWFDLLRLRRQQKIKPKKIYERKTEGERTINWILWQNHFVCANPKIIHQTSRAGTHQALSSGGESGVSVSTKSWLSTAVNIIFMRVGPLGSMKKGLVSGQIKRRGMLWVDVRLTWIIHLIPYR